VPLARSKQSSIPAPLEFRSDLGWRVGHTEFLPALRVEATLNDNRFEETPCLVRKASNQADTELHRVHTEFHRVDINCAAREA
jgi:hypothetical protein